MKKTLAIILALMMVLVFVASCNNTDDETSSPPASSPENPQQSSSTEPSTSTSSAPPSAPATDGPVDNTFTGEIGMFNPDYDYNANPRYKVTYVVANNTSGLYTASSESFAHWASLMNIDYGGMKDFGGDTDGMFSQLPQLARDNDGLLMDADATMYDRVYEIMTEAGKPWHSFMAAARDYSLPNTPLLGPYVGFEQYDVGSMFAEYLLNCAPEMWPDVPLEEFGFITVDYTNAPPLHEREMGAFDRLSELNPDMAENRYFVADTAINFFDADTSQQVVSAVLSMNPQIQYWLVFAEIDDMAQGAAAALELAGLTDTAWVSAFGGSALVNQWDSGVESAWRSVYFLPQTIFTEPVICSLYAFMNGDATPETIFPEWHNVHEDKYYGDFSTRLLPFYEIRYGEYLNYKHMLAWSDVYANSNIYPNYPREGIDRNAYPNSVPVPDSYK